MSRSQSIDSTRLDSSEPVQCSAVNFTVRVALYFALVCRDGRRADRAAAVGPERAHLPRDAHASVLRHRARTRRARRGMAWPPLAPFPYSHHLTFTQSLTRTH